MELKQSSNFHDVRETLLFTTLHTKQPTGTKRTLETLLETKRHWYRFGVGGIASSSKCVRYPASFKHVLFSDMHMHNQLPL